MEQATCHTCSTPLFWTGRGPRPRYCPEHAKNPRRHDPEAELVPVPAKSSKKSKQRASRQLAEERTADQVGDYAELRMAVALELAGDDAEKAARIGGIRVEGRRPTHAELLELAKAAKDESLKAAREGHSTFVSNLISRYLALTAITMLEELPLVPPPSRPHAMRMAQQVLEALGGARLVYSTVNVNLGAAPGGDR